jgi:hypothetical protein
MRSCNEIPQVGPLVGCRGFTCGAFIDVRARDLGHFISPFGKRLEFFPDGVRPLAFFKGTSARVNGCTNIGR